MPTGWHALAPSPLRSGENAPEISGRLVRGCLGAELVRGSQALLVKVGAGAEVVPSPLCIPLLEVPHVPPHPCREPHCPGYVMTPPPSPSPADWLVS